MSTYHYSIKIHELNRGIFVLLMIACSSKVKLIEDNRERKPERKILSRRVKRTVQFIFSSKKEVQFGLGFSVTCFFIFFFFDKS